MNTGIGDAVNLAWKLAWVLQQRADASILDSYEPERIAFARRLVRTTDQGFVAVTSSKPLAKLVRLDVVPVIMPLLFSFRQMRRLLYRTVSQTNVNYRVSPLSQGQAGAVHGGDRLPWFKLNETDNFAPLKSLNWQVHVYGEATDDVKRACLTRTLPLHIFPWLPAMDRTGLHQNAVYLIRPDGYIALVTSGSGGERIGMYLDAHQIVGRATNH